MGTFKTTKSPTFKKEDTSSKTPKVLENHYEIYLSNGKIIKMSGPNLQINAVEGSLVINPGGSAIVKSYIAPGQWISVNLDLSKF